MKSELLEELLFILANSHIWDELVEREGDSIRASREAKNVSMMGAVAEDTKRAAKDLKKYQTKFAATSSSNSAAKVVDEDDETELEFHDSEESSAAGKSSRTRAQRGSEVRTESPTSS